MIGTSKLFNISLIILALSQVFNLISPDTSSVSKITWIIWILICLYSAFITCKERGALRKNKFIFMLILFWCINAVSYYISPKLVQSRLFDVETLVIFKSLTIALFSYFPLYYCSKHGSFQDKKFRTFLVIILLTSVANMLYANLLQTREAASDHNVLNEAYYFVQLLPLIMLFFSGRKLVYMLVVCMILILFCMKRGAILCAGIEMIVFFFYKITKDQYGKTHKARIFFLVFIIGCIGLYFILGNEYLVERLFSTGSDADLSGDVRKTRYELLYFIYFNSSTLKEIIFGYGFAQTVSLGEGLAHQDWAELLIDNGCIGLGVYIIMILICLRTTLSQCKYLPSIYKYALVCCLTNWCLMATYSMVYGSRECFLHFLTLGLIHGLLENARRQLLNKSTI